VRKSAFYRVRKQILHSSLLVKHLKCTYKKSKSKKGTNGNRVPVAKSSDAILLKKRKKKIKTLIRVFFTTPVHILNFIEMETAHSKQQLNIIADSDQWRNLFYVLVNTIKNPV